MRSLLELTDEDRTKVQDRLKDVNTQLLDSMQEIHDLIQLFCVHNWVEDPDGVRQCGNCYMTCTHKNSFKLTRECSDCGWKRVLQIRPN